MTTDINGIRVKSSIVPKNKPSINEWMKEFKVSSRYNHKPQPQIIHVFNVSRFKQNIDQGLILAENEVS